MSDIVIFSESFVLLNFKSEIVHFDINEQSLLETVKGSLKSGVYYIYQNFNTNKGDILESTNKKIVVF